MMFGWFSLAADWASRRNRLSRCSSAPREAERVFTATKRVRTGSWARNTSPVAPWPILLTILYFPICSRFIGPIALRRGSEDDSTRTAMGSARVRDRLVAYEQGPDVPGAGPGPEPE